MFVEEKSSLHTIDQTATATATQQSTADMLATSRRLTNVQIADIVDRYRERCIWEDRVDPPRRYFDH